MFILSGSSTRLLFKTVDYELKCPMCASKGIYIAYHQAYHHIFFLPTFPIRKVLEARCLSCTAAQQDCITQELLTKYKRPSSPVWYWSGTFIFMLVVSIVVVAIRDSEADQDNFLRKPVIGDIYTIKDVIESEDNKKEDLYVYFQISKIDNDSIEMIQSDFVSNRYVYLKEALKKNPRFFGNHRVQISRARLKQLYESDKITSIDRAIE